MKKIEKKCMKLFDRCKRIGCPMNTMTAKRAKKKSAMPSGANPQESARQRESKDITCAVRLNRSLYNALDEAAKRDHTSLSDIIRDALVSELDKRRKASLIRMIEDKKLEATLSSLRQRAGEHEHEQGQTIEDLEEIERILKAG